MLQNKYMVMAGIGLGVVVLAGGSFALWQGTHKGHHAALQSAVADAGGAASQPVALTQAGAAAADTGGLSVGASSAASSIGQLAGNTNTGGSQGSSAGSGTSSSSAPAIDPTTFAQYDKYKNNATALFGDAQVGTGTELTSGHKAAVYYRGWLTNGQLFDESKAGSDGQLQPFVFTLGAQQVIPGWEQGLSGMKVGGVRLLIVPPALGYGATGQGSIPPNSVLVFQVQLLEVQ